MRLYKKRIFELEEVNKEFSAELLYYKENDIEVATELMEMTFGM